MFRFLFSFKGRINRVQLWAFYVGIPLMVGLLVEAFIKLNDIFGGTLVPDPQSPFGWPDKLADQAVTIAWWAIMAWYFCSMVVLIVKRLHDRNRSAWWLTFFYGVPLSFFATAIPLGWPNLNHFPGEPIVMGLFFGIAWLTIAWYLTEILFLPGTRGNNSFGPQPKGIFGRV